MFWKIVSGIWSNQVRWFNCSKSCKCPTRTASTLVFDWSHITCCCPVPVFWTTCDDWGSIILTGTILMRNNFYCSWLGCVIINVWHFFIRIIVSVWIITDLSILMRRDCSKIGVWKLFISQGRKLIVSHSPSLFSLAVVEVDLCIC